jgi:pantetheine-phosphate adenylyltransferase
MKRTVIYPGSFNPLHEGHIRVIKNGLEIADKVLVMIGTNPNKPANDLMERRSIVESKLTMFVALGQVEVGVLDGLLADYVRLCNAKKKQVYAIIKGMRNHIDLEEERAQLYNNQDLGIGIPTLYFLADRDVQHISSTSIKTIEALRKK